VASDQQVNSRSVLRAISEVRREGTKRVLEHLEQVEPDLASHLMEELSLIHRDLLHTGAKPIRVRRLQRQIESLVLVCVTALRVAHYELWRQQAEGTPLADLDTPPEGERPAEG